MRVLANGTEKHVILLNHYVLALKHKFPHLMFFLFKVIIKYNFVPHIGLS
jgi:hypothetical protein